MAKQWHQLERLDHKSLKKLQGERDRLLQVQKQEADYKRVIAVVLSVLFVIGCIFGFILFIRKRAADQEFQAQRQELYKYKVIAFGGEAFLRTIGDWEKIKGNLTFEKDHTFKTEKNGFVTIELQLGNQVKLASQSEMLVPRPTLHKEENRVVRETVQLAKGEATVLVSRDGQDILWVETGPVISAATTGLYKAIFNPGKNSGEVVVKNGLVEVFKKDAAESGGMRVKVSGFYKVTFQNGAVSSPAQASVIQYDWR